MAARLTIQQARAEVLRRVGNSEDGANSPDLLEQISSLLGSVQRLLCVEHAALLPRRTMGVTITAGRRWYPLPCSIEGLVAVEARLVGKSPSWLDLGMQIEDAIDPIQGIPLRYEVRPTKGVTGVTVTVPGTNYINGASVTFTAPGGTEGGPATGLVVASPSPGPLDGVAIVDPGAEYLVPPTPTIPNGTGATVTVTIGDVDALFLAPAPSGGGTLWVTYRDVPAGIVADTDTLIFDAETVIAVTAAEYATATKHPLTEALTNHAAKAMALVAKRSPLRPAAGGGGFSLSGR